jgi:hypothetical protein
VRAIRNGWRSRIHPRTAAAILKTRDSLAAGQRVSQAASDKTRERLRRLMEEEHPLEWLRERVGEHAVRAARRTKGRGETGARVRVRTWRRVKLLHQRLLSEDLPDGYNEASDPALRDVNQGDWVPVGCSGDRPRS